MLQPTDPGFVLTELLPLREAVEATGDIVYDWDLASDSLSMIGRTEALFGLAGDGRPATGEDFSARVSPEDQPARLRRLSCHMAGQGDYDCEYRLRGSDGEFHWVHDRGAVSVSPTGVPQRLLGILRVVTQRKQHEAKLEYQASFDELTGHFNKMRLREALDQALAQSLRYQQTGAFIVIGLDQMGMINTAYGHKAGDKVLFDISQRLDACLRASDVIGRLGGDRFGVVLGCCSEEQARVTSEKILRAVRQSPVSLSGKQAHVTASAAVVLFPEQSKTPFDVMAKAEGALLRAKNAGRDCIQWYEMSEEQRRDFQTSLDIGEEVKLALKEERLIFAYQPIVEAASGAPQFHECLLRMQEADGTLVPAGRFIPVIEQLGLMRAVDRRGLDLVLAELEAFSEVKLAVNISGLTATDRSWLRTLSAALKERRDLAERLLIEITETVAMYDIEETARFVAAVRDLGCRVAVDDFGAGYTTFRHLRALTVDVVKIDGSFVKGVRESEANQLFLRNLLSLAQSFGLLTVAECVETAEDADYLVQEGVDLLQGYYFGMPTSEPDWHLSNTRSDPSPGVDEPRQIAK